MVFRAMQMSRNDTTVFPCTEGSDIVKDFAEKRRPLLKQTLRVSVENL